VCVCIMIIIFLLPAFLFRSSFCPARATIHSALLFFVKLKKAPFEAARVEEVALIMMVLNFVILCAHTLHSERERAGRITFQPG
jgi:hypothetical protein